MAGQVPNPGGWSPTSSPSPPDYWSVCLDGSDTAVHISYRRELFKSLVPNRRRLSSPTDEELFSESSGTMSIDCPSEGGWQTLELPNALYVPRSNDTCLSISMLFKQHANSRLQLTPEGCSVELNVGNGVIRLQAEPKGCFSFSLSKFPGFLSGMSTPSERSLSPWTSPSRSLSSTSSSTSSSRRSSIWDTPRSSVPPVSRRKQMSLSPVADEDEDEDMDVDTYPYYDANGNEAGNKYEYSTEGPYLHSVGTPTFRSYGH